MEGRVVQALCFILFTKTDKGLGVKNPGFLVVQTLPTMSLYIFKLLFLTLFQHFKQGKQH